jgi:hypothetical protein
LPKLDDATDLGLLTEDVAIQGGEVADDEIFLTEDFNRVSICG